MKRFDMKVLVLIMGARNTLSEKNIQEMKNTFITDAINDTTLKNEYTFAYYDGGWEYEKIDEEDGLFHIRTIANDDVHSTFEKTMFAFELSLQKFEFDVLVRINISSYINIRLLDSCIDTIDTKCIYANKLLVVTSDPTHPNFLAPRGDFFMTGRDVIKGILEHEVIDRNRILDHVDDVLIGCAFAEYVGNSSYVDRLKQIQYCYLPHVYSDPSKSFVISDKTIDGNICYRLKTVPPNEKVSGYSWDYNKYRDCDVIKMKKLHEIIKDKTYSKSNISRFVIDEKNIPCVGVQYVETTIGSIKNFIKKVG